MASISANGSKGHHKFTLNVNESGTSIPNNTSTVSWSFILSPIQAGWDWYYTDAVKYTINVAGKTYSGSINNYDGSSTVTVRSGTVTVTHNPGGDKRISFSFSVTSLDISYLPGSASKSGTLNLTNIPRAASITSAPDFNDESNPTIKYSNPAGNAVSSLQACIAMDNGSGTDVAVVDYRDISKTGSSYTFNLTNAERTALRNKTTTSNSRTVSFYIKTVIGYNTLYSKVYKTFSIKNPNPLLNPTVLDANTLTIALTGSNSKFIKYYSNAYTTLGATAVKGSTIKEQSTRCGDNISTLTNATFNNVDSNLVRFWVKDSRGNQVTKDVTLDMVNYIPLTCNLQYTPPTTNGNMSFTIEGNYFNNTFGAAQNTLTVQYRWKSEDDTEWGMWTILEFTPEAGKNSYKCSKSLTGLDYKKLYYLQARAFDRLAAIQTPEYSIKGEPVFDFSKTDFNFNVPITFNKVPMDAFVTEQGTKNGWYYRKWSNNYCECWKSIEVTTAITTSWGTMYVGNTKMSRQNYPFVYKTKPYEQATLQAGVGAAWLFPESSGNGVNSSYASAIYSVCRPNSANNSNTFYINLYACGEMQES